MRKCLIFIALLLLGCQSDKGRQLDKVLDDDSHCLENAIDPTSYAGYAYAFFNENNFQDGYYLLTILPVTEKPQS